MEWLLSDFAFAAKAVSEANLSGLVLGLFASLLAMTVAVEVRIKNPSIVAKRHYLIRRGVLIVLYVLSMFFASVFVGLTLPSAKDSMFSVTGTLLCFVVVTPVFLLIDYWVQSAKANRKAFMLLFTSLGIFIQFAIHAVFIFVPNNQQVVHVRWSGLIVSYVVLFVCMGILSRFAHDTSNHQTKTLQSRMIYIAGIVALNQGIALALIGFIQMESGSADLHWLGLWLGWSGYEVVVSAFALVMISVLICYVYVMIEKSFLLLQKQNQTLEEVKDEALGRVASTSEELGVEKTRNEELKRAMQLDRRGYQMSVQGLVAAVTSLEDGIFELDFEQDTITFSPVWVVKLGMEPDESGKVSLSAWRTGVLSDDAFKLDSALQFAMHETSIPSRFQLRYEAPSGSVLKLEISLVGMANSYGLAGKAVGVLHDRTEEMDLELSIREELSEESLLSSKKSQFVTYLSHEIRTPMTVISSAKALLENSLRRGARSTDVMLEYIDQIGNALKSLRALVDETLMFMGVNYARKNLVLTAVNVPELFSHLYEQEQRRHHLSISGELMFNESVQKAVDGFWSDEGPLSQVFRQILIFMRNKSTETGDLQVSLSTFSVLEVRLDLLQWPAWMSKAGQLEPNLLQETVIPVKGESLPFELLLVRRLARLINGNMMIKNCGRRHWLCVELPSLKELSCLV